MVNSTKVKSRFVVDRITTPRRGKPLSLAFLLLGALIAPSGHADVALGCTDTTTPTTYRVSGEVSDPDSGVPLPCRLYLQDKTSGEWFFPKPDDPTGTAVEYRRQIGQTKSLEMHSTLSANSFEISLPPGQYRMEAVRGKEYLPAVQDFEVIDRPLDLKIPLERFIRMSDRGWYSGDVHIHRPLEELRNVILAEDLNVGFPMTYWVRDSQEIPASSNPVVDAKPVYLTADHVLYPINTEYEIFTIDRKRHTQGAVLALNHQRPLNSPAPPTLAVAEEVRRQGGLLDLEKHSWAWSMMIVPNMNVDLFELSNNHNWRTEFAFSNWTIENAPDWPEIERNSNGFTELGWTQFALQTYYSLLNCGFRMRVSAGTGSGVHPVAVGHSRVYVHTGHPFTYEKWIEHLNSGHSFVTTGPLMDIRFNGDLPGSTWTTTKQSNQISIAGTIIGLNRLKSIEIIHNGVVAGLVNCEPAENEKGIREYKFDTTIETQHSGWVAIRCFEDLPHGKVSFAHTNPVFLDVSGHPQTPRRRDAAFFVQRMAEEIQRNSDVISDESLSEYRRAKAVYEEILSRAQD